jgi:hypothetical protein
MTRNTMDCNKPFGRIRLPADVALPRWDETRFACRRVLARLAEDRQR